MHGDTPPLSAQLPAWAWVDGWVEAPLAVQLTLLLLCLVGLLLLGLLLVGLHYRRLFVSERNVSQSREQYRQLFQTAPDGLVLVTADGLIRKANPAMAEMFGWPLEQLVGLSVEQLLPESLRSRHVGLRASFHTQEGSRPMGKGQPLLAQRRDGTPLSVEISLVPQPGEARTMLCIVRDVTQRRALELRLLKQAREDSLTGLHNRRAFADAIGQALADAGNMAGAVMLLDLDHFKRVNDTLGHNTGDALLCEVAVRLRAGLRAKDTLARMGGDEFAVLLPNPRPIDQIVALAERLIGALSQPFVLNGHVLRIGASIGIARFPEDGTCAEDLLGHADLALYRAKAMGRNTWSVYTPEMDAQMQARQALENDLREALARGQLSLHYQPRMRARDGSLSGLEALLRWHHPVRGNVPPDEFIPLAEEAGLIQAIGDWVLRQACQQAARWARAGLPVPTMAVNVSTCQLQQAGFAQRVAEILVTQGWPAHRLELEITESALMEDTERSTKLLRELAMMGVRLAVDDFGTGYSSLAYLKTFPLHRLKVDRTFVGGLETDENDRVLTAGIIALAHSLRLAVTAEGVETAAQERFLVERGCDELQGYRYSRPLPAAQCEELLERHAALPA